MPEATNQQRIRAAQKALEEALAEWHMPTTKDSWHTRYWKVIRAAEELRKAKKDSAL